MKLFSLQRGKGAFSFLVLLISIGASACSTQKTVKQRAFLELNGQPDLKQELRWSNGARPKTLDPAQAFAAPETDIARTLFEGLTELDGRTLSAMPALAEAWEHSDDFKIWKFRIRGNAKWSNGEPVTARDIVDSWNRLLKIADKSPAFDLLLNFKREGRQQVQKFRLTGSSNKDTSPSNSIDTQNAIVANSERLSVYAENENLVRIELVKGDRNLPELLTHPIFRPVYTKRRTSFDLAAQKQNSDDLVTNGAFRLDEISDDRISLVRSENYWNNTGVKLEKIHFLTFDNSEAALNSYREGKVDLITNAEFSAAALKLLEPYEDLQRITFSALNYYEFNRERAPLNDVRVRRALSMAIERERLVESELQGTARAANGFLPFTEKTSFRIEQDISVARQLLADAGYKGGKGFPTLRLVVNRNELQLRIARQVVKMWQDNLGITVEIVPAETSDMDKIRQSGDYDLIRRGAVLPVPDELAAMLILFEKNANRAKNASFQENSENSENKAFQNNIGSQIITEAAAIAEMPAVPLSYPTANMLIRPYVKGLDPNAFEAIDPRKLYIDTEWQPVKK
jgi:oligopeptide transport system substrate-binding protein